MAVSPDGDLKEKAAGDLKLVNEIAKSATKTAMVGFGALAIIWFTQMQPQYKTLLATYVDYQTVYGRIGRQMARTNLRERLRDSRSDNKTNSPDQVQAGAPVPAADDQTRIAHVKEGIEKKNTGVREKTKELDNLVKNIAFELFGMKMPVPPFYACAVWNILLLILLTYLAHARYSIWTLCARAVSLHKRIGRSAESLYGIAGRGPVWLAPPPSRPGKSGDATIEDLHSAFGWNRLKTLPSVAVTVGLLLLGLLQFAVTAQGYEVLEAAHNFTAQPTVMLAGVTINTRLQLSQELQQGVAELTIGPVEASLLSLFLLLTLLGTVAVVFWWFRPSSVAGSVSGGIVTPQHVAIAVLSMLAVLSVFVLIGWRQPESGVRLGGWLSKALPGATRFLAGSVTAFCLIQLLALAFAPKTKGIEEGRDGKRD